MARRKKSTTTTEAAPDEPAGITGAAADGALAATGDQPGGDDGGDALISVGQARGGEVVDFVAAAATPETMPEEASEEASEVASEEASQEAAEGPPGDAIAPGRLPAIIESLLFASDKPLTISDLKRLLHDRDGKRITEAVEALADSRIDAGVQVVSVAGAWQLRTNPEHGVWVSKLLSGKPVKLSRAMLETLAIVSYRQPITRPEVDDIRGVDCGPVIKTLLDRGLIRMIGKKEEVGRPILYGTTAEFLKTFSLRDLTELPTLRQFHELGVEEAAKVAAEHGGDDGHAPAGESVPADAAPEAAAKAAFAPHGGVLDHGEEDEGLLDELDQAAQAAARAVGAAEEPTATPPPHSTN